MSYNYESIVKAIVRSQGGYREKSIIKAPHKISKDPTWNDSHKVLNINACFPEQDGYFPGFQVDIVTYSICG